MWSCWWMHLGHCCNQCCTHRWWSRIVVYICSLKERIFYWTRQVENPFLKDNSKQPQPVVWDLSLKLFFFFLWLTICFTFTIIWPFLRDQIPCLKLKSHLWNFFHPHNVEWKIKYIVMLQLVINLCSVCLFLAFCYVYLIKIWSNLKMFSVVDLESFVKGCKPFYLKNLV